MGGVFFGQICDYNTLFNYGILLSFYTILCW
jgi:hypothetical protein